MFGPDFLGSPPFRLRDGTLAHSRWDLQEPERRET